MSAYVEKKTCLLDKIIDKLDESGDLNDFMTFLKLLSNGKLPHDNIVVQLLFERAKFQDCKNTVGMRYCKVTKLFWSIVYRLCKGVGLKFFFRWKELGPSISEGNWKKANTVQTNQKLILQFLMKKHCRTWIIICQKLFHPGKLDVL